MLLIAFGELQEVAEEGRRQSAKFIPDHLTSFPDNILDNHVSLVLLQVNTIKHILTAGDCLNGSTSL